VLDQQRAEQIISENISDRFLPFRKSFIALLRRAKDANGQFAIEPPEAERAFLNACQRPDGEFSRSWRAESLKSINTALRKLFDAGLLHEPLRLTNYRRAKAALAVDTELFLRFPLSQLAFLHERFLKFVNQAEWTTYSLPQAFAQFVFACARFVGLSRPGITLDLICLSVNDLRTIILEGFLVLPATGTTYRIHCPPVVRLSAWILYRLICPMNPEPAMLSQTLGKIIDGNDNARERLDDQFTSRLHNDLNMWLRLFSATVGRAPTMGQAIQMCRWEAHHTYGNVTASWLHGYHVYNPIVVDQETIFEQYQQPFHLPALRESC
jgi:hypothetical protein